MLESRISEVFFLTEHTRLRASLTETFYLHLLEAWNISGSKIITDIFQEEKKKHLYKLDLKSPILNYSLWYIISVIDWFTNLKPFVLWLLQGLFFLSISFKVGHYISSKLSGNYFAKKTMEVDDSWIIVKLWSLGKTLVRKDHTSYFLSYEECSAYFLLYTRKNDAELRASKNRFLFKKKNSPFFLGCNTGF